MDMWARGNDVPIDTQSEQYYHDDDDDDGEDEQQNIHPLRKQLTTQTNDFILENWDFRSETSKQSYLSKDMTGLACLCFPFALDDRIHLIARFFSIIYLLGDIISNLDFEDAEVCLSSLQEAVQGYWEPDRSEAEVWMLCDLFDDFRSHEYMLVEEIIAATWTCLRRRIVLRGRRASRQKTEESFRDSFLAAGLLFPLHQFATGGMIDKEEFEYSQGGCAKDDVFCSSP